MIPPPTPNPSSTPLSLTKGRKKKTTPLSSLNDPSRPRSIQGAREPPPINAPHCGPLPSLSPHYKKHALLLIAPANALSFSAIHRHYTPGFPLLPPAFVREGNCGAIEALFSMGKQKGSLHLCAAVEEGGYCAGGSLRAWGECRGCWALRARVLPISIRTKERCKFLSFFFLFFSFFFMSLSDGRVEFATKCDTVIISCC